MKGKRRKFIPQFKASVAIEAIWQRYTLLELAEKFNVRTVKISRWKKEFSENSAKAFGDVGRRTEKELDREKLYAQIGQLKVGNDF